MDALTSMRELFPPLAGGLMLVFVGYLALIPLFALAYHRLFKRNRSAYAFVGSVLRTQSNLFQTRATQRISYNRRVLSLLSLARLELKNAQPPSLEKDSRFSLTKPWVAKFEGFVIQIHQGAITTHTGFLVARSHSVTIILPSGEEHSRTFNEDPEAELDLHRLVELWAATLEKESTSLAERLRTIGSETPDIWNYVDFLYFSLITQTTVGYGDILPNSTGVRALVSLQVLLGYCFLVVLVNFVLTSARG